MNDTQNIVVTGAGLASNLGLSRQDTWDAILQSRPAFGPMSALESPLPEGKDGAQAVDLPPDFAPDLPREVRYLRWTIQAALHDAKLTTQLHYSPERCTALLGTTLHGMRAAGRYFRSHNLQDLSTFLAGNTLQLALADLPFAGLAATTCSACSSSLASIGLAVTLLQTHQVDLVIAGGYDTISEYVYAGFNSLRLVAQGPLRPFAKNRQGMKVAEGYGILVLERASDAKQRGVAPLAVILGWGESSDAHHLTQPDPQGQGAARAIRHALSRANLRPDQIHLAAAHATGTPDNDASEFAALSTVFTDHLKVLPVTAYKSHLGHTLGGAGAVELILSAMALANQIVPPCANIQPDDIEFPPLQVATGSPRKALLQSTLNTSLGFGGSNTAVVLGPPPETTSSVHIQTRANREVFITGIGVVLPGLIGNEAFRAYLTSATSPAWTHQASPIHEETILSLLNARRVRRMSDYVKLSLAATTLACRDAAVADMPAFADQCGAILGTTHGSSNYSVAYYEQIVKEGINAANPMLFAEAVPNGGAAQLSLMLALKGSCQAIIGTRTAGLDALSLATARIQSGAWDRAIVGAGEEFCTLVNDAHHHCGMATKSEGGPPFQSNGGFVIGAGAITFILESKEALQQRNHQPKARITHTAASRFANPSRAIHAIASVLAQLENPTQIMTSASSTWIDRAEASAIRRTEHPATVSTIYGHIAETFSATPLAAIAAVLLSRKLPRLLGNAFEDQGSLRAATGNDTIESFAALCTDAAGSAAGTRIQLL